MQKTLSPVALAGVVVAILAVIVLVFIFGIRKPKEPTPTFAPPERAGQLPPVTR